MSLELRSDAGLVARFSPFGARLVSLHVPRPNGTPVDVVVGHETLEEFKAGDRYAGAICGRFANRIANGAVEISGKSCLLLPNEGNTHLHGGPGGFDSRIWKARHDGQRLAFYLRSPDGDQGYPGALDVRAVYGLTGWTLSCVMEAEATHPTVINLTQHTYWNLAGNGPIADHILRIEADDRTVVDQRKIPTGMIAACAKTPYDFREPRSLRTALVALPDGLDDNFVLRGVRGQLHPAATLEAAGLRMEVHTTEPGLQVYTANHHGSALIGKKGQPLLRFGAIALEPQNFPNAPNVAAFPRAVFHPGETYRHRIEWRFSLVAP